MGTSLSMEKLIVLSCLGTLLGQIGVRQKSPSSINSEVRRE